MTALKIEGAEKYRQKIVYKRWYQVAQCMLYVFFIVIEFFI